jgi:hypothetical protein
VFSERRTVIAQNINLSSNSSTLGRLFYSKVIDENCRNAVNRRTVLLDKGTVLVDYLLAENKVLKYEDFIDVWEKTHSDHSSELRGIIYIQLQNVGLLSTPEYARPSSSQLKALP